MQVQMWKARTAENAIVNIMAVISKWFGLIPKPLTTIKPAMNLKERTKRWIAANATQQRIFRIQN